MQEANERNEQLPAYIHACDIYAYIPRMVGGAFEGFGIVYLQAGAAGKPVVASRSGGVPDAVRDGVTGVLVPEGDVDATADTLVRLLQNPVQMKKLGDAGRVYARTHQWKEIARQYIDVYQQV